VTFIILVRREINNRQQED